ncbi:uncharacterized protein C16orf96 homolog [Tiliqua scincoides]|uniref:uncharacterized protein C16orf96 homolog n=1 Tax=Tiliqua scincoides TaxID=71010 RepID=UPI0034622809
MSQSLTFLELVNLAIGTPELGNVNFNALHYFLHGMLDHLHLSNVKLEISEDEKDFINPPQPPGAPAPAPTASTEPVEVGAKRSSSIFHQMQDRISNIERQLGFLNDTPTTTELLSRSEAGSLPAQDMWQLMQLKKKMELNEEGMTKAMRTLQELLNNISSLKKATDTFHSELGNLKESFSKFNIDDVKEQLRQLDEQAKGMEEIRQQIGQVKARTGSIPDFSDMVQWSTLYEMLSGKHLPEKDRESREKTSRELLATLGLMPEKHEELVGHLARLEAQLGQAKGLSEISPELGAELKSLLARMEYLQAQNEQSGLHLLQRSRPVAESRCKLHTPHPVGQVSPGDPSECFGGPGDMRSGDHERLDIGRGADVGRRRDGHCFCLPRGVGLGTAATAWPVVLSCYARLPQGKESLNSVSEQMQSFKKQCEKLQKGMDKLSKSTADLQIMREMLEQLDITKADKAQIQEEMDVKADKSALEAKVNHGDLKLATTQLSEMMQDLLQKMSLQDKDWQKALEKLFTDMDCKLDRMALDPLSRQLEAVWKVVKKYLSEGPRFDADSAAGFKKCILHMITVRKVPLRPRPASANGYEYLARPHRRDPETNELSSGQPQQTCWQCQAHHQSCTVKQLSRSQDLTTIYPYGDPTAITYDNTEVDILGVNGVLYKGRVNAQAGERLFALQREFTAVRTRRPPSALRMERARSATTDATSYVSPYASSSVRRIGLAATGSNRQQEPQPQCVVETVDLAVPSSPAPNHLQDGGGVTGI